MRTRCGRARPAGAVGEAHYLLFPRPRSHRSRESPDRSQDVSSASSPARTPIFAGIARLRKALAKEGAVLRVIAETGGKLVKDNVTETVDRTLLTTRSIEYDAVVVAAGSTGLDDPKLALLLAETNRHYKVLGSWGDGDQVLNTAGIDTTAPGVICAAKATPGYLSQLIAEIRMHRAWDRVTRASEPAERKLT